MESRFGVGKTRVICGFTNTRCLDSTGSQFQVGCQSHLKMSNHGFSFFWLARTCASNPLLLLTARNVYDLTGDNLRLEVEVVDPIVDNMGMEVKHFISPFKRQGHYKLDQPMFPFWSNKLANVI